MQRKYENSGHKRLKIFRSKVGDVVHIKGDLDLTWNYKKMERGLLGQGRGT